MKQIESHEQYIHSIGNLINEYNRTLQSEKFELMNGIRDSMVTSIAKMSHPEIKEYEKSIQRLNDKLLSDNLTFRKVIIKELEEKSEFIRFKDEVQNLHILDLREYVEEYEVLAFKNPTEFNLFAINLLLEKVAALRGESKKNYTALLSQDI